MDSRNRHDQIQPVSRCPECGFTSYIGGTAGDLCANRNTVSRCTGVQGKCPTYAELEAGLTQGIAALDRLLAQNETYANIIDSMKRGAGWVKK